MEVIWLEVVEVEVEVEVDADADADADVEATTGISLDVVKGTSELLTEIPAAPVVTASVVVGSAKVVLISENTVAVIVLCVFGIAPATESQI